MASEERHDEQASNPNNPADSDSAASQPAAPQYEAPHYAPPSGSGYAPVSPVSNLQLSYWLSVFFVFIPALIFWIIEKEKGDERATRLHAANLNFALIRTALWIVQWILFAVIVRALFGSFNIFAAATAAGLINVIFGAAALILLILHVLAAVKVPQAYQEGKADPFVFNFRIVK